MHWHREQIGVVLAERQSPLLPLALPFPFSFLKQLFKHRRLTGTWFQKSLNVVQQVLDGCEHQTPVFFCPSGSGALFQFEALPKFRWNDDLALRTDYGLVSCHRDDLTMLIE